MKVVVDASVAAKWYADEDDSALAETLLTPKYKLHAPQLMLSEFAGIMWKKKVFGDMDESLVFRSLKEFLKVPIKFYPHEGLIEPALKEAIRSGHPVYDWVYLTLAVSLNSKFITADRKFFTAIRRTRLKHNLLWIEHLE